MTRPLLKWAGGRRQLLPHLRPLYPRTFNRYIEPFVGSGAVSFDLHDAGRLRDYDVVLIDSNADLMGCALDRSRGCSSTPAINYRSPSTSAASPRRGATAATTPCCSRPGFAIGNVLVAFLAVAALWLQRRRLGEPLPLWSYPAYLLLAHMPVSVEERFGLRLVPLAMMCAGAALVALFDLVAARPQAPASQTS